MRRLKTAVFHLKCLTRKQLYLSKYAIFSFNKSWITNTHPKFIKNKLTVHVLKTYIWMKLCVRLAAGSNTFTFSFNRNDEEKSGSERKRDAWKEEIPYWSWGYVRISVLWIRGPGTGYRILFQEQVVVDPSTNSYILCKCIDRQLRPTRMDGGQDPWLV